MKYKNHFFICTNQKKDGEGCAQYHTQEICKNLKQHFREQGVEGVRINQSGCLGECAEGPVLVVYPEGDWYRFFDQDDVQNIIQTYIDATDYNSNQGQDKKIILESLDSLKL